MAKLKKKVKRNLKIILVLFLTIFLFFGFQHFLDNNHKDVSNKPKEEIKEKEEEKIKTYTASLIATGDGLIHQPIYSAYYDSSTNTYDFSSILSYTKDKIKDYDIKYYNQETISDDSRSIVVILSLTLQVLLEIIWLMLVLI